MKKLSKQQLADKTKLIEVATKARDELEKAIDEYNRVLGEQWADVLEKIEAANEAIDDMKSFVGDVEAEINDAIEEKSEKWLESDKGQAVVAWREEWAGLQLNEIVIDEPEELEMPEVAIEEFEGISDEVE